METQKKTAGKTAYKNKQRVVLNLNLAQAKCLTAILSTSTLSTAFCSEIANRLDRTITKHENSEAVENLALLGTTRNPEESDQ